MSIILKQSKVTERGQVTLPKAWRDEFNAKEVEFIKNSRGILEVHPLEDDSDWETIFDAEIDGPMSGEEFMALIKKSLHDKKNR